MAPGVGSLLEVDAVRVLRPGCGRVLFDPTAFDALGGFGDVLAVAGGGFGNVLGSLNRGTLVVEHTKTALLVGLTERDTAAARDIADAARVAPIYVRPVIDLEASEYTEADGVRTFQRAEVRAFLVKPTPNDDGHTAAVIDGIDSAEAREARIWL